jgi:hypothetical protein
MKQKQLVSWRIMLLEDFLGCLEASFACISPRRTVHLSGKICTKDIINTAVW